MPWHWIRRRRRQRLLAAGLPDAWRPWLGELWFYGRLAEADRARLHDLTRVLVAEKNWEGVRGLDVQERMCVLVAAQAALLILKLENDHYPDVQSVLIHPDEIQALGEEVDEIGIVHEGGVHAGESWHLGAISLSWTDVLRGIQEPGEGDNVVFHEFAHRLDQETGWMDGTPQLASPAQAQRWGEVMAREFAQLGRQADQGREPFLDTYGATEETEFFAVVTESFFDRPRALKRKHAALYEVLRSFYGQDPANW